MACENTELFNGVGSIYIRARGLNSGAPTSDYLPIGDAESFEIGQSQSFIDEFASCDANRAKTSHLPDTSEITLTIVAKSLDMGNLAIATNGSSTTVSGSTVTNEALTFFGVGGRVPLAHPNVSSVVVKNTASPAVTLTVNVDYSVDLQHGTIKLLSHTNIPGSAPYNVTVNYTYGTYDNLEGFTASQAEYSFRFEGVNRVTGKPVTVEVYRVATNLAETIALLQSGSNARLSIAGEALLDSSKSGSGVSQYFKIQESAAA